VTLSHKAGRAREGGKEYEPGYSIKVLVSIFVSGCFFIRLRMSFRKAGTGVLPRKHNVWVWLFPFIQTLLELLHPRTLVIIKTDYFFYFPVAKASCHISCQQNIHRYFNS